MLLPSRDNSKRSRKRGGFYGGQGVPGAGQGRAPPLASYPRGEWKPQLRTTDWFSSLQGAAQAPIPTSPHLGAHWPQCGLLATPSLPHCRLSKGEPSHSEENVASAFPHCRGECWSLAGPASEGSEGGRWKAPNREGLCLLSLLPS